MKSQRELTHATINFLLAECNHDEDGDVLDDSIALCIDTCICTAISLVSAVRDTNARAKLLQRLPVECRVEARQVAEGLDAIERGEAALVPAPNTTKTIQ